MDNEYKLIARDHFALAALNGLLANPTNNPATNALKDDGKTLKNLALTAYCIADCMLWARTP